MRSHPRILLAAATSLSALATGVLVLASAPAGAAPADPGADAPGRANSSAVVDGTTYSRFIVHFDADEAAASDNAAARSEIETVGRSAGHALSLTRRLSTSGVLLTVDRELSADEARRLMAAFANRPSVDFVEPDVVMTATMTPTDPQYVSQWHYSEPTGGMNLPTAWNTADGAGVTVAVIDTGIVSHSDLNANVVTGYDFISDATAARDGNGRDSNPADQGDWYGIAECGTPYSSNSSWHGTHVAGTIAALTNNGVGVSGVAYAAKVSPVRVLGKCGGTLADIADAVTWASGGTVSGVPANPNVAKVINMSLGGSGTCGATYQNAINGAVARGTTVVVAAGNSNANAANYQPASCANTVVVAATDRIGDRASYSNYGTIVDLSAPGGETATRTNGVLSTLNTGTTTPGTESYQYYQGTSMATPHVAGLAALVLGEQPGTSPAQMESLLKAGTRPLPGVCSGGCGTGIADATKTIASLGGTTPTSPSPSPSPTETTSPSPEPTTPPSSPETGSNDADLAIGDKATVESAITIGRTATVDTVSVTPEISHAKGSDLQIDLVAPDGTIYRVKGASKNGAGAYATTTYTVSTPAEATAGTWRLRVTDKFAGTTGTLLGWTLTA